jgi:two-component system, NarL family, nitrate/nitrite response regulator NarL
MGPPIQKIRVFVVADIRIYREGLTQLLAREPSLRIVGSAARQDQALARLRDTSVDIVLLDMAMAASTATIRAIARAVPRVKVVALAVTETDDDIVACAEAGVAGYVPRGGTSDDLIATVKSVARGEALCSPRAAATLLRRVAVLAAERPSVSARASLTPRQAEILELIGQGLSNKEIARRLCIALSTVKNHVHYSLEKLGTHRRAEAAALVRQDGDLDRGA